MNVKNFLTKSEKSQSEIVLFTLTTGYHILGFYNGAGGEDVLAVDFPVTLNLDDNMRTMLIPYGIPFISPDGAFTVLFNNTNIVSLFQPSANLVSEYKEFIKKLVMKMSNVASDTH